MSKRWEIVESQVARYLHDVKGSRRLNTVSKQIFKNIENTSGIKNPNLDFRASIHECLKDEAGRIVRKYGRDYEDARSAALGKYYDDLGEVALKNIETGMISSLRPSWGFYSAPPSSGPTNDSMLSMIYGRISWRWRSTVERENIIYDWLIAGLAVDIAGGGHPLIDDGYTNANDIYKWLQTQAEKQNEWDTQVEPYWNTGINQSYEEPAISSPDNLSAKNQSISKEPYRIDKEPYRIDTGFVVEGRLPGKTSSSEDQENVGSYRIDTGFVVEGELPKSRNPSASPSSDVEDDPSDWEFEPEPIDRSDDPRIPLTLNDRGRYRGIPNDDNSGLFTPSSDVEDDSSDWEFEPEPIDRSNDPRIPLTLNDRGEYRDVPRYHPVLNHLNKLSSILTHESSEPDFSNESTGLFQDRSKLEDRQLEAVTDSADEDSGLFQEQRDVGDRDWESISSQLNDDAGLFTGQEPSDRNQETWEDAFDDPNDENGFFQQSDQHQEREPNTGNWIDTNDLPDEEFQPGWNSGQEDVSQPYDPNTFDDYQDSPIDEVVIDDYNDVLNNPNR